MIIVSVKIEENKGENTRSLQLDDERCERIAREIARHYHPFEIYLGYWNENDGDHLPCGYSSDPYEAKKEWQREMSDEAELMIDFSDVGVYFYFR